MQQQWQSADTDEVAHVSGEGSSRRRVCGTSPPCSSSLTDAGGIRQLQATRRAAIDQLPVCGVKEAPHQVAGGGELAKITIVELVAAHLSG